MVVYDHPSGEVAGLLLEPDNSPKHSVPENTALYLSNTLGFYVRMISATFPARSPYFKFAYATTLVEAKRKSVYVHFSDISTYEQKNYMQMDY